MVRTRFKLVAVAATLAMACSLAKAGTVLPSLVQLEDLNSKVLVDLRSQAGVESWQVDGASNLFQQWFWVRTGDQREQSIDTLGLLDAKVSDVNFNEGNDTLVAVFGSNDGLKITLSLNLTGAKIGSKSSDLAETIKIENAGSTALPISFFQYVDFDLNGGLYDDIGQFPNSNTVTQKSATNGLIVSETVVTPAPTHREVALRSQLLDKLNDERATTLADNTGPVTGDVAWAFQWDRVLNPGQSLIISKDKNLKADPVPLPDSVWMGALLLGGIGITSIRRRIAA